jgi:hypothetical protein
MGDPSGQCNKMVIGVPGGIQGAHSVFSPELSHPLVRVRLGIREKLCKKKKKGNRYKDVLLEDISL